MLFCSKKAVYQARNLRKRCWPWSARASCVRPEDLLYERLDPDDRDGLAAALRFYSALNALPDAELEARNFPRDEILSGLTDVCRRCGLEDVLHALPGGEDEPRFDA